MQLFKQCTVYKHKSRHGFIRKSISMSQENSGICNFTVIFIYIKIFVFHDISVKIFYKPQIYIIFKILIQNHKNIRHFILQYSLSHPFAVVFFLYSSDIFYLYTFMFILKLLYRFVNNGIAFLYGNIPITAVKHGKFYYCFFRSAYIKKYAEYCCKKNCPHKKFTFLSQSSPLPIAHMASCVLSRSSSLSRTVDK